MTMPEPERGWVDAALEEELPELSLWTLVAGSATARKSPPEVRKRLGMLASRFRGAEAIELRRRPIPHAYRVFFRQIGLDPDLERTPIEAAVHERMLRGGFLPGTLLEDILLVALLDTSIPVWALASAGLDGPLGVRLSAAGERLGSSADGPELPAGRLVVADASTPLAVLFGERAPAHLPVADTRDLTLFTVAVAGVPGLYAEEALWICSTALGHR
jgi:DNA/RNA-binding domain of Phe-tRNA-synthetase-like protein